MSSYDRTAVEALVPTIFDRHYAWGLLDEQKPDPQMPKAKGLKNETNTLWACLADIRRAWSNADIPTDERRALLLVGGFGATHNLAAYMEGVGRSTVSERYERGVGRLAAYLNGKDYPYDDIEENSAQ